MLFKYNATCATFGKLTFVDNTKKILLKFDGFPQLCLMMCF